MESGSKTTCDKAFMKKLVLIKLPQFYDKEICEIKEQNTTGHFT